MSDFDPIFKPPTEEAVREDRKVLEFARVLARDHARLHDREAKRQLLERLRAKYHGMKVCAIQGIGDHIRHGWLAWIFWALVIGYLSRRGIRRFL